MLTTRQKQIAELVGQGMSRKAIAREVGISPSTVKDHVERAAAQLPGNTPPRHKLILWFFSLHEETPPFG